MSSNPVMRRVGMLSNQWLDFAADDRARVFCWKFASDEVRMMDAFLALETDERSAEHSDLFVGLESAFVSSEGHCRRLRDELLEQYGRDQSHLQEEGLDAAWVPPDGLKEEAPLAWLIRTCASFAAYYGLPRHLVLVLRPKLVNDPAAYGVWLLELARALPGNVRAVAVDADAALSFTELEAGDAERLRVCSAGLDMPAAYTEIHENSGKLDTPGGKFRDSFLRLTAAIGARDLAGAEKLAQAALAIASEHQWFYLCVPIHALLGSTYAADKQTDAARSHHLAAEQAALRGQTEGMPEMQASCVKLRLQSRVTLGASLIVCEAFGEAATVFQDTLPLAAACGDDATRLDCYRLASYCHERAGELEPALRWGLEGLQAAKQMTQDVLATSNLPHLGAALLRLCKSGERDELAARVEREMDELTGSGAWRSAPPEPATRAA